MNRKEWILCAGLACTSAVAGVIALVMRGRQAAVATVFWLVIFGLLILAGDIDHNDRNAYGC